MTNIEKKRTREKKIVKEMIELYCKHNHHSISLCDSCKELADYSCKKIDHCPFMETKTFCSKCPVHCYKKDFAERIRIVMKFSGPRIFFYHPIVTIKHLYLSLKDTVRGK